MSLLLSFATLQIKVFAEDQPVQTVTVQLTAAQTLALYGQSFSALYYDGSTVQNVIFNFDKSSKTVVDQCNDVLDSWSYGNQMSSFFPSGVQNGITSFMCNNDNSSTSSLFSNQLWSNSEWLGANNGSIIDRDKLQTYEFLIYKCEGIDTEPVSSSSFDFQFNINFPFVISGVDRFQSVFSSQIGIYTPSMAYSTPHYVRNSNLGSEIRLYGSSNQLYPIATTSDTHISGDSSYFGYFFHPLNTCDPSKIVRAIPTARVLDLVLSYYGVFGMCVLDESISNNDITGINWNIRNCNSFFAVQKQGFSPEYTDINDPNSPNYQWQDNAVYLMLMCPRIQGDFVIGRPSGSSPDYTAPLNDIIDKLDQIVENFNIDVDFDTTNLENTIVSTGNSIVTGIKNLFIPTQTDLINFRLDLEDEFHSLFPAFYTAEDKIDSVFSAMQDVSAVDYLTFPGVSVDLPAENGGSANFKIDSGAVALKPFSDRLGALYDCLALAIDIIATLAFFNMLRNRFNKFFGEGAEE